MREGQFHLLDCSEPRGTPGLLGHCWEVHGPNGAATHVSWGLGTDGRPTKEEAKVVAEEIAEHMNNPWKWKPIGFGCEMRPTGPDTPPEIRKTAEGECPGVKQP